MSDATPSGEWSRSAEEQRRYNLLSGLVFTTLGVILLVSSFMLQSPAPLAVRAAIIVFVAVCIAISFGLLPVLNPQDVFGSLGLILLGLTAFIASNELPGMRGFAFGPGTAPRLFATAMIVLALIVLVGGFLTPGPEVTKYQVRGMVFVIGAILAFAASIRPLGLVVATFASVIICAAAADDVKARETVLVAIGITIFCALLFPYGLNLPFQLWPRFW
jgi:putative tricarboxylic transport membrane protein